MMPVVLAVHIETFRYAWWWRALSMCPARWGDRAGVSVSRYL